MNKRHGLILAPKPIKPHECSNPGFWYRLLFGITEGSVYRCKGCSTVYSWYKHHGTMIWLRQDISFWLDAGGSK